MILSALLLIISITIIILFNRTPTKIQADKVEVVATEVPKIEADTISSDKTVIDEVTVQERTPRKSSTPKPIIEDDKLTSEEKSKFQARMAEKNIEYINLLYAAKFNFNDIDIYDIPDFENDSIAFLNRASFLLDSLYATPEERRSESYLFIKNQNACPEHYNAFHSSYLTAFFNKADQIFFYSKDSYTDSLKKSAKNIIPNRPENYASLPSDEQQAVNTMISNAKYDYNTATITKYVIKLREDKGLPPLPAEFLNYYENQKR